MNILIFSWRGLGHPHSGGAESVTHHHAKAWVEAGHSVTLFTSSYKGANKNEIVDGVKIRRMGSQYLTVHILAFFWYFFQDSNTKSLIPWVYSEYFYTAFHATLRCYRHLVLHHIPRVHL